MKEGGGPEVRRCTIAIGGERKKKKKIERPERDLKQNKKIKNKIKKNQRVNMNMYPGCRKNKGATIGRS